MKKKPKGAYKTPTGRWKSAIRVNGAQVHLGTYDTSEEAEMAYKDAVRKYRGEFYV